MNEDYRDRFYFTSTFTSRTYEYRTYVVGRSDKKVYPHVGVYNQDKTIRATAPEVAAKESAEKLGTPSDFSEVIVQDVESLFIWRFKLAVTPPVPRKITVTQV